MRREVLLGVLSLITLLGCGKTPKEPPLADEPPVTKLTIIHPFDEAVFPPDMRSPEIRWADPDDGHKAWFVRVSSGAGSIEIVLDSKLWIPPRETWEKIKSWTGPITLEVFGLRSKRDSPQGEGARITFTISSDPVGAPLFFRAVPNPFPNPDNFFRVKWKLAWLSSYEPPKVVMSNQPKCFNCHVMSADGSTLGFEYNFKGDQKDRGGYLVTREIGHQVIWRKSDFFDWNLFVPEPERERLQAFLSIISPNGDYIVTSGAAYMGVDVIPIRDAIGYQMVTKGILLVYSMKDKTIKPLPGADDPRYVHVPTSWSPDGRYVFFSRALVTPTFEKLNQEDGREAHRHEQTDGWRELDERYGGLIADVYRIPFNDGKGGVPEPVKGASGNGRCNYFARISPDGRWIAFTQSAGGVMVVREDSDIYIVPSEGGEPRKLRGNGPKADSWHSWSPNSRWLVFASKSYGPRTELLLTHIDENGNDSVPVLLSHLRDEDGLVANLPEFLNIRPGQLEELEPSLLSDL